MYRTLATNDENHQAVATYHLSMVTTSKSLCVSQPLCPSVIRLQVCSHQFAQSVTHLTSNKVVVSQLSQVASQPTLK